MICEELAQITIYLSARRAGSGLMLSCINYRSVWGCWCWHTSHPAHYQRQELPLQETGACHSVVTPGTFHHSSSSHINIFYNKLRGPRTGEGSYLERESDGRSDRKQECPKLRFRRKGCTYKYECKEECVEKKDCKTTYQYKCKEYRKQVTDHHHQLTVFQSEGKIWKFPPSEIIEIYNFWQDFLSKQLFPCFSSTSLSKQHLPDLLLHLNYYGPWRPWSWKK